MASVIGPSGGFLMLEMIFLIIAAAASGAGGGVSSSSVQVGLDQTAVVAPPDTALSKDEDTAQAPPSFLAPAEPSQPAAAAPLFLTPGAEQSTGQTEAAPAFLAPPKAPALVAEPQTPTGRFTTATEVKPILNATKSSWILVREYDGKDLMYVTHLWSWRCGLLEIRVGINGNEPEVWPMPECRLDQPSPAAILESDGLPFREFPLGSVALIEIALTYDDLSTDSAKFNRQGMLLP